MKQGNGPQRCDALREELVSILHELARQGVPPHPHVVIDRLKARAGKDGTIYEVVSDGVKWHDRSGELRLTSREDVAKRLRRLVKARGK